MLNHHISYIFTLQEQEIAAAAEKLSECQQTILDLGKQLKALGASKNLLGPHSSLPMLLQQKISSGEIVCCMRENGKMMTMISRKLFCA